MGFLALGSALFGRLAVWAGAGAFSYKGFALSVTRLGSPASGCNFITVPYTVHDRAVPDVSPAMAVAVTACVRFVALPCCTPRGLETRLDVRKLLSYNGRGISKPQLSYIA